MVCNRLIQPAFQGISKYTGIHDFGIRCFAFEPKMSFQSPKRLRKKRKFVPQTPLRPSKRAKRVAPKTNAQLEKLLLAHAKAEVKTNVFTVGPGNVDYDGLTYALLEPLTGGTDDNQRVGNQVHYTHCIVRYDVYALFATLDAYIFRMIIGVWEVGALPAVTDVLDGTGVAYYSTKAFYSKENRGKYHIISDKTIVVNENSVTSRVAGHVYVPLNRTAYYDDATASEPNNFRAFVLFVSDMSNAVERPRITFVCKQYYTDK